MASLNIGPMDTDPIYRIMPVEEFVAMLCHHSNVLRRPALWDDPFEKVIQKFKVRLDDGQMKELDWKHWYAQCWSIRKECDGLWRNFTHNKEVRSVKIETTIGQLRNSLNIDNDNIVSFAGCVEYVEPRKYKTEIEMMANIYASHYYFSPMYSDKSIEYFLRNFELSLLTHKRIAFEYENEYRLLSYLSEETDSNVWDYDFKVNDLISRVVLDPWTKKYEFELYYELFKEKLEFEGDVEISDLYREDEKDKFILEITKKQNK